MIETAIMTFLVSNFKKLLSPDSPDGAMPFKGVMNFFSSIGELNNSASQISTSLEAIIAVLERINEALKT